MNYNEAIFVIESNYYGNDPCFIYTLHEKRIFINSYWIKLLDAIQVLVELDNISSKVIYQVTKIRATVYSFLIFHLDQNDLYTISDLGSNLDSLVDGLDIVFDLFFEKHLN